jgi:hypothetical protein
MQSMPHCVTQLQGSRVIHPREKRLFWIGLFAGLIAWAVLAFFALVRFKFGGWHSAPALQTPWPQHSQAQLNLVEQMACISSHSAAALL